MSPKKAAGVAVRDDVVARLRGDGDHRDLRLDDDAVLPDSAEDGVVEERVLVARASNEITLSGDHVELEDVVDLRAVAEARGADAAHRQSAAHGEPDEAGEHARIEFARGRCSRAGPSSESPPGPRRHRVPASRSRRGSTESMTSPPCTCDWPLVLCLGPAHGHPDVVRPAEFHGAHHVVDRPGLQHRDGLSCGRCARKSSAKGAIELGSAEQDAVELREVKSRAVGCARLGDPGAVDGIEPDDQGRRASEKSLEDRSTRSLDLTLDHVALLSALPPPWTRPQGADQRKAGAILHYGWTHDPRKEIFRFR